MHGAKQLNVGGLWSCLFLTLLVLPAEYAIWRQWQFSHAPVAMTES
jgi:Cu/Ag efflux pump CusA